MPVPFDELNIVQVSKVNTMGWGWTKKYRNMLMLMTFTTQFSFDTFIKKLTVRKSMVILQIFLTVM